MINKNGKIAVMQILILVIGIVAFNFQLGGVKAAGNNCVDSDGGKDYYVAGHITINSGKRYDSCDNLSLLSERYCGADGFDKVDTYDCSQEEKICWNGICQEGTTSAPTSSEDCTDSDGGKNYYVQGTTTGKNAKGATSLPAKDECEGATLHEFYCNENNYVEVISQNCANGCKDAACIKEGTQPATTKSSAQIDCEKLGGICKTNCLSTETQNGNCGGNVKCCFKKDTIPAKTETATTTSTTKECKQTSTYKEGLKEGYDDGWYGAQRKINPYYDTITSSTSSLYCKNAGYVDGFAEGDAKRKLANAAKEPSQQTATATNPTNPKSLIDTFNTGSRAYNQLQDLIPGDKDTANRAWNQGYEDCKNYEYDRFATGNRDVFKGYENDYDAGCDAATTDFTNGNSNEKNKHDATASAVSGLIPKLPTKAFGFWSATGYGQIIENAGWAMAVYVGVKTIGNIVGMDKAKTDAAAKALGWGYFAGKTVAWGIAKYGAGATVAHTTAGGTVIAAKAGTVWGIHMGAATAGLIIGAAIAISIFAFSYKDTKTDKYIFNCEPWQANTGGSKCEDCNKQGVLGCNEYQCRSLGQSCEIINAGTDQEKCAWVNKNDVKAPEIKVSYDALLKDYTYNPTAAVSPPDRGVKVEYKSGDKCVPSLTAFTFGFDTNELARCKIDYQRKNNFDDMSFYFGGSNQLIYNHTQAMSLPGSASLENANITLQGGAGNYDLYVKCQDANGNTNTADFVFKFCVDKGPDATAPRIETTSILNGEPVRFGTQKTDLEVYTNEPANCKWSIRDQDYSTMENEMLCAANAENMNTAMLYTCETTLTDLQNKEDNTFYFRCQDTSPQKNTNTESYKFILKGSQELVIDSVGPTNKTIKGSTESVPVTLTAKTSFGFNEGVATCQYSETDEAEKYVDFFETHSYTHSQVLVLKQGTYKYYIKCFDIAGNSDTETVSFTVEADPYAPVITRIYREDKNLKLITNKEASCVYTTFGCSYDMKDGTKITTSDGITHLIGWETRTQFYIKCTDESKNKPLANECSVIIKPLDI